MLPYTAVIAADERTFVLGVIVAADATNLVFILVIVLHCLCRLYALLGGLRLGRLCWFRRGSRRGGSILVLAFSGST